MLRFRGLVAAACAASLLTAPHGAAATPPRSPQTEPSEPDGAEEEPGDLATSEPEESRRVDPTQEEPGESATMPDEPAQQPPDDDVASVLAPSVPPPTLDAAGGLIDAPSPPSRGSLGCRGNAGCVKLTAGGIVVSALSAGTLAGGIVLTLRDDEVLADDPTRMRTYRPAGEMMLTLGAGLLATGVLMLVASRYGDGLRDDGKRRRHRRAGGVP